MSNTNVLGLQAAHVIAPPHKKSRFELLVRHLLTRLCHNEMVSIDGDMSRALQTAWAATLPQLVVTLICFVAYHQPPRAKVRGFWPQAGDHYFFVMYAIFVLGSITLYSWDLLFPDTLDVFILGPLPVRDSSLLRARITAMALFLAAALIGTNILGIIGFPLAAGQPRMAWHLLAHVLAVGMAGTFAAATVLALQGTLLVLGSERIFQRLTPLLQTGGMLLLFAMIFSFPQVAANMEHLLNSRWALWFPPFWLLGIYQRVMLGAETPAIFTTLALRGILATAFVCVLTCMTYPIAYRKKVKLAMEGSVAVIRGRGWMGHTLDTITGAVLRKPVQRGIFRFIGQTLWRSRRPRAMMALFTSIGIAMAAVRFLSPDAETGLAAIAIVVFWVFFGLRAAFASPVDLRGTWIFRAVLGRERSEVLDVQKHWSITAITLLCGLMAVLLAIFRSISWFNVASATLVAAGFALVASSFYNRKYSAIPFTEAKKTTQHERPMAAVRYLVVFPIFLMWMVRWMKMPWTKLTLFAGIVALLHLWLAHKTEMWRANDFDGNLGGVDPDAFPTALGLRE